VIAVTFADLAFRARQFLIAILGVGLVLSMALLLSGLSAGFKAEIDDTVGAVGATTWYLSPAAQGRVSAFAAMPEIDALAVDNLPGVSRAAPLLVVPGQVVHLGATVATVVVIGVVPHRLGDPAVIAGHQIDGPDQVVIDRSAAGAAVGSHLRLGAKSFTVVGLTAHRTLVGGVAVLYMPLASAQAGSVGGQPLITAVVATGHPIGSPKGLVAYTTSAVEADTLTQLGSAATSIDNTRWLMWAVAAAIVASMLYVAALERKQDFAVLKALGSSTGALFGSLVLESVVVTLLAAAVGELLVNVVVKVVQQPVDITLGARAFLPVIAVIVGMISSVSALRRVTGADPAAAFG
jgi:putative ABC transport system permease protein